METKNSSPKPERAELPRISDRLTFIYAERCSISRDDRAFSLTDRTVFPAHAGVIPGTGHGNGATTCFPRVCGGDPRHRDLSAERLMFSPRMRV